MISQQTRRSHGIVSFLTRGLIIYAPMSKNLYLETPLDRYEYMRMPIKFIPQDFIDLYDLASKVNNCYVYMEM